MGRCLCPCRGGRDRRCDGGQGWDEGWEQGCGQRRTAITWARAGDAAVTVTGGYHRGGV